MSPAMSSLLYENPENPWEMIDTPWGRMPSWKASTMATGTMGAFGDYLKVARADAAMTHETLSTREDAVAQREQAVAAREAFVRDAIGKVRTLVHRCDAIIKAEEERREQEREGPLPSPPANDEGDLEPKPAKEPEHPDDLEGDLKHPENSMLTLPRKDECETEFPQPGEPDLPEPDRPRAPSAFEDN
jgi:hypothetical protein